MLKDTYCPITAAAKILQPKWNIQILRSVCLYDLTTFNDIRRLLPNVSPTLLSQRLKFLIEYGVIEKRECDRSNAQYYHPTDAGKKLTKVLIAMGEWGRGWLDQEASVHAADGAMLLWILGQKINANVMPKSAAVLHFCLDESRENGAHDYFIMFDDDQKPELTDNNFGYEPDLVILAKKSTLAACYMNYTTYATELKKQTIVLEGDYKLQKSFTNWMATSELGRANARLTALQ
jgi:DNA-binding HxlR family transcriptional regulator